MTRPLLTALLALSCLACSSSRPAEAAPSAASPAAVGATAPAPTPAPKINSQRAWELVRPYLNDRRYAIVLDNCRAFLDGKPLRNQVDKASWF